MSKLNTKKYTIEKDGYYYKCGGFWYGFKKTILTWETNDYQEALAKAREVGGNVIKL